MSKFNWNIYFPTEDCKNRVCTFLFSPVCGSDGITYPNACTLEIAACQKPKDKIKITKRGACDVSFWIIFESSYLYVFFVLIFFFYDFFLIFNLFS